MRHRPIAQWMVAFSVMVLLTLGCGNSGNPEGTDVGATDTTQPDEETPDSATQDSNTFDTEPTDTNPTDTNPTDTNPTDTETADDGVDAESLCQDTLGTWDAQSSLCDCGPGGAWGNDLGCWGAAQDLCEATEGTWSPAYCGPYCGDCDCSGSLVWDEIMGCHVQTLEECLDTCGDGCFLPEHMVCGEDGAWWCPCEMACHGLTEAANFEATCCNVLPPGCVSDCQDNIASNCVIVQDEYGCKELSFTTMNCGGMACVVDNITSNATCVDPCEAMDAAIGPDPCFSYWGWSWDGVECVLLAGGCPCEGSDCDILHQDEAGCLAAHDRCINPAAPDQLCTNTSGSWDADAGECDCMEGGGWDPMLGCYPHHQLLCWNTSGNWMPAYCGPYCGDCECLEGTTWDPASGCL